MTSKKRTQQLKQAYDKFHRAPKYGLNSEELYCICRKPDNGELMISCDGCNEWFHFKCMHLNKAYQGLIQKFYCVFCDELFHKGKTQFKRKCRLPGCMKPARVDGETGKVSSYCSDEHGIKFMKEMVISKMTNSIDLDPVVAVAAFQQTAGYAQFEALGKSMPEFDKATSLNCEESNRRVIELGDQITKLEETEKTYSSKENYLVKLRVQLKRLNDCLSEENLREEYGDRVEALKAKDTKQNRAKLAKLRRQTRVDICGFNTNSRLTGDDWTEFMNTEMYRQVISNSEAFCGALDDPASALKELKASKDSDTVGTLFEGLCVNDKKKCSRHLTWYSIIYDSVDVVLGSIHDQINRLKAERDRVTESIERAKWDDWTDHQQLHI